MLLLTTFVVCVQLSDPKTLEWRISQPLSLAFHMYHYLSITSTLNYKASMGQPVMSKYEGTDRRTRFAILQTKRLWPMCFRCLLHTIVVAPTGCPSHTYSLPL
jgi:hypothetical protein